MPFCIGIDIGKKSHKAAFHIPEQRKKSPVHTVQNERESFEELLSKMREHAPPEQSAVLLESTGHYGANLIQYLQENNVTVYRISPKARYGTNASKNDVNDARTLALLLYQQIVQNAKPIEKSWHVRKLIAPSPTARLLRGLVQDRAELSREITQRKNKLIAIEDELFPERKEILAKPYSDSALALLIKFPSPQVVASASIDDLCKARHSWYPTRKNLERLKQLAATTIGTKDTSRIESLLLRQELLIAELQLHQAHMDRLDKEIEIALQGSRAGQILASFKGIGPANAATLLAHIGSIDNFEKRSELRAFLGWAPKGSQTGTSYDVEHLDKKRNKPMRALMFLIVSSAIQYDEYWKALYEKLVPLKCVWDGRKKDYTGKMKVIGIIAGQIIDTMFFLLKKDAALVAASKPETGLKPPELYDPSKLGGRKTHATPPPVSGA